MEKDKRIEFLLQAIIYFERVGQTKLNQLPSRESSPDFIHEERKGFGENDPDFAEIIFQD